MYESLIYYIKESLGLDPIRREIPYFNPEKDFQDIKKLMPVEDYSLIYTGSIAIICLIVLFFVCKHFIKSYIKRKQDKQKVKALNILSSMNMNDGKDTAYKFTKYAIYFVNEECKKRFNDIEESLNKYKYTPYNNQLSKKERIMLEIFIGDCHV